MAKKEVKVVEVNKQLKQSDFVKRLGDKLAASDLAAVKALGENKKATQKVYDLFCELLGEAVFEGSRVQLKNVGTFTTKYRPAREYTNAFTKSRQTTPDTVLVKFKSSSVLKDKVATCNDLLKGHQALLKAKK